MSQGGLTFVFSDIEGSTRLVTSMATGWGLALRICRRMVVDAFAEHGGREFGNEGDGQFFVFSNPQNAAIAAVAAQRRITASSWPDDVELRVRMGIHCGPVRMSGGEYVGMTIHEVARICGAANGGQVLCSADIAREIRKLPDVELVDLGRYVLRGIAGSHTLYQLLAPGLDGQVVPPRDALREGGRRVTIWRRDTTDPPAGPQAIEWGARSAGVDVSIVRSGTGDDEVIRLTVTRNGVVEEEYDGLTIGGACDVAAVVNATSRLIGVSYRAEGGP